MGLFRRTKVRQTVRRKDSGPQKVTMTYAVPPELLRKEGLDVKEPVNARVEIDLPKGVLPKDARKEGQ
jgi:hypothetical protein